MTFCKKHGRVHATSEIEVFAGVTEDGRVIVDIEQIIAIFERFAHEEDEATRFVGKNAVAALRTIRRKALVEAGMENDAKNSH